MKNEKWKFWNIFKHLIFRYPDFENVFKIWISKDHMDPKHNHYGQSWGVQSMNKTLCMYVLHVVVVVVVVVVSTGCSCRCTSSCLLLCICTYRVRETLHICTYRARETLHIHGYAYINFLLCSSNAFLLLLLYFLIKM